MSSKIITFFLFFSLSIIAQISPGELTTVHANLEGLSNCTKCHELGEKVLDSNCLDCHSKIRNLMNLGEGYHSSGDVKGHDCTECHPEHFGRNFKIINFDPRSFNHNKTKFSLTGSHKRIECKDCHQPKYILDSEIKKNDGTYLGLSLYCFNCHKDIHQKTLGDNCNSCHGTEKFKPAEKFVHNNSKFQLTGAHKNVNCIKCHPVSNKNGKKFQKFTGLTFSNCSPCHNDVHRGQYGSNCKNCHLTSSFALINRNRFDHDRTNFPLLGRHEVLKCDKCHGTDLRTKLKYEKCPDCHSDSHNSQFLVDNILQDCKDCHNETGFHPSTITTLKHNTFKFKINGSHLAIPCQSCHFKKQNWIFRNLGLACIDCHINIHGSEILDKFLPGNNCLECHSTESWSTINFNHDRTEFILAGKHKSQSCSNCHKKENDFAEKELIFKSINKSCEECHYDIHAGQFKTGNTVDCNQCHGFNNWEAVKFDHEKTKFSLKGAHEKLKCISCHKMKYANDYNFIQYRLEDFKCASCHT